jgi:hypothetical protein
MPTTIRTRHTAVTPNPSPMTKLRLPFFWSEQGLESGRKTQGSYSGYKKKYK